MCLVGLDIRELILICSISTIKRQRDALQLFGPRSKKAQYTPMQVEQAVLIQLDKDPSNALGLASIKFLGGRTRYAGGEHAFTTLFCHI